MSLNSGIYWGNVRHRRFGDISHQFGYRLYMMGIDVDEISQLCDKSFIFGQKWYNPIRFLEKDYVRGEPSELKQRIERKVRQLGGSWSTTNRVIMLIQCRCFGVYFSPINCYFCYDAGGKCQYMLAEVSNTPWRERHYYLVDLQGELRNKKEFHVSPFMDLNMDYLWRIRPPKKSTLVHIENHTSYKVFDATLTLMKWDFSARNIMKTLSLIPFMTIKVVTGIYWQALQLFIKKVPFVAHPNTKATKVTQKP